MSNLKPELGPVWQFLVIMDRIATALENKGKEE